MNINHYGPGATLFYQNTIKTQYYCYFVLLYLIFLSLENMQKRTIVHSNSIRSYTV